jgi:predicted glycoside hydrolase/deacetylase ChbG (UPF0249 family)
MAPPVNESVGASERVLIVNADDFGRSAGINRGVIRGHREGIVTSATLMVRWPDAEPAAAYGRRSGLSLGLHLDLGEWEYRDGQWLARYEVLKEHTPQAAAEEVERQLERFHHLVGQPPTHLDSHQFVHRSGPAGPALRRSGERLGVPVRGISPEIAYRGDFYGQDGKGTPMPDSITVEGLIQTIEQLPVGVTELGCHPAAAAEGESVYDVERVRELETLCDPRVRAAIEREGISLRSFADLAPRGRAAAI